MNPSGEAADLVMREGIQLTESAVRLAGLGAKHLAALLLAVVHEQASIGRTRIERLVRDGDELTTFSIKREDLDAFHQDSKRFGVLYCPVVNTRENTGTVEIIARVKDTRQINVMIERLGYPAPAQEASEKKETSRAPSANGWRKRGTGTRETGSSINLGRTPASTFSERMDADGARQRPSVVRRLEALRAAARSQGGQGPARGRTEPSQTR